MPAISRWTNAASEVRNPDPELMKLEQEGLRGRFGNLHGVGRARRDLHFFNLKARFALDSLYFVRAKIIG
jgi:hypothetical protein